MMRTKLSREVIVVGGGVSGLVTAWQLKRAGVDVLLIEADSGVGGCMRSERRDGFILEKGPFNVLVRDESFHALLNTAGTDIRMVQASEESKARYVLQRGALHQVPTGPGGLIKTPLLSLGGKLRLLRGMVMSRRSMAPESTIGEAATRRLGHEVAETFVSSIVAGVFGGDSRRLSLPACFPNVATFDREARSPLAYGISMMRRKKKERAANPAAPKRQKTGLVSFDGGLQSLGDWLAGELGLDLLTGCRAEVVTQHDNGYEVHCRMGSETVTYLCKQLVLATPKEVTARWLREIAPPASDAMAEIESSSLVVINLGYNRSQVGHPMQGYGFLVPQSERDIPIMGVLWADSAFPHHAPPDHRLVRVFMGGPRDPEATSRRDEDLLATAERMLISLLHISGKPSLIDICRWPDSIPQYTLGHGARVQRITDAVQAQPGLHVVGSYLKGVSINDCVRQATETAAEVTRDSRAGAATPVITMPPTSGEAPPPTERVVSSIRH